MVNARKITENIATPADLSATAYLHAYEMAPGSSW